jgi:hypothetical protein
MIFLQKDAHKESKERRYNDKDEELEENEHTLNN